MSRNERCYYQWFETLPSDWKYKKIKFLTALRSEKTNENTGFPYIGLENIEPKTGIYLEPDSTNNEEIEGISNKFYKNDVLFGKLRPYLAKCILADFEGICTTELLVMKVKEQELSEKYLKYLLLSPKFIDLVNSSTYGSKMPRANGEFIKNIEIPVPTLEVQRNIEKFIENKTDEIDNLIIDKERLVRLLEEKRRSMITEAVTKGLNPNVKMKNSGVEWIGEIPDHWTIKKIKHISTFVGSGKTPKGGAEIYPESGVLFLRSMNVHYDGIRLKDIVHITPEIDEDMRSTRVKSKDVLLNITGASIGRSCIVPESLGKANVNQHVCIIRSNTRVVVPELLSKIMSSNFIMQQILMSQNGSSREGLNFTQVKNLEFPLTRDLHEQIEIANHISVETDKVNSLISMIKQQIQKLKDYRQSLIYEAVTGKIDVRDFEIESE
ncbi:restriction endonuclease subunit S [Bacillus cereus]|uniref:restriction endonuclease subunit S n=1 Tax=Bacillus paramycoides TaxID=2026194 RepID=UPI000BF335AB|nr:restriction endonuclease subunit S [Bacillus paramycoides]PFD31315.1 restriction endonuclease subunit S [Bacillus cereus]